VSATGAGSSRSSGTKLDAVVVGAGPNGLAAAITLAQAGRSVLLLERNDTVGGGVRTAELTLPGFRHDVCSSIHPLVPESPFFRSLDLPLTMLHSPVVLAHPFDDGSAALVHRSVDETAAELESDGHAYRRLLGPTVDDWRALEPELLGPLLRIPRHPVAAARFGTKALRSVRGVAKRFETAKARALVAGAGAHSTLPLEHPASASFALVLLALAHAGGWPFPEGGSQAIADALAGRLRELGGRIETGRTVTSLRDLPTSRTVLCDLTPRQLVEVAGELLPPRYRRQLARWRYGPGVFKLDYALDGPIPWRAPRVAEAATVHLGGSLEEISASEHDAWNGRPTRRPFVLLAQQSLFDPTRAPDGKQVAWAYCHVPNGSDLDVRDVVEAQIERFAPGFRDRILACSTRMPGDLERDNPNLVGGDIGGGANNLRQILARPALRRVPYATPVPWLYVCSSATPPGGGVHGMCGHLAAKAALSRAWHRRSLLRGSSEPEL
jgi:phytoene dehydrogenase-like protein